MFMLLLALVLSTGCSTLADARAGKGSGPSRVYSAPFDKVWAVIPTALKEVGIDYVGENKQEGYILAQRGVSFASYGENVAIFVEQDGDIAKTRVEVVSKKSMSTNIFAPNWAEPILNKIDEKLRK
jgi:uncharacterized lipoprotein